MAVSGFIHKKQRSLTVPAGKDIFQLLCRDDFREVCPAALFGRFYALSDIALGFDVSRICVAGDNGQNFPATKFGSLFNNKIGFVLFQGGKQQPDIRTTGERFGLSEDVYSGVSFSNAVIRAENSPDSLSKQEKVSPAVYFTTFFK